MSPVRYATITELREVLGEHSIRPKHKLGQNFLIDLNLLRLITDAAELEPRDVVLEVGCGAGALTRQAAERAGAVVAVEIDPGLHNLAVDSLSDCRNVTLILGDALDHGKLSLAARRAVEFALASAPGRRLKLVANLPYGIATAVMRTLIEDGPRPVLMVVTVQSEVAERMSASPGTREYGLLSVVIQANGQVERLRTLKPQVFWPRPKVSSAVVRMRLTPSPPPDLAALVRVAGKLLEQRRKQLVKAMQVMGFASSREAAAQALSACAIDPYCRPEGLSVEEFQRLARELGGGKP